MSEDVTRTIALLGRGMLALAILATGARMLLRLPHNALARRRAEWVLALTALPLLLAVALLLDSSLAASSGDPFSRLVGVSLALPVLLVPIAFGLPLLKAELLAADVLRQLLGELARNPSRGEWRDRLADMIGDPKLELGFWEAPSSRYVGADGREMRPADVALDRCWMEIDRAGEPLAVMITDPQIESEPELKDAVAAATVAAAATFATSEARLEVATRAAEATEYERLRMARDVQSGVQQRLAALRVQVTMHERAAERSPETEWTDRIGSGLDLAMTELRDTILAADPSFITQRGLGLALRAARRGTPATIRVLDIGLHRHPARSELAVYYACLEAMQNAVKHGGPNATVTIRLRDSRSGGIEFSVTDDGVGFDPTLAVAGAGLQNIRDRVISLGGDVTIDSAPERGTVVAGTVPDVPLRAPAQSRI